MTARRNEAISDKGRAPVTLHRLKFWMGMCAILVTVLAEPSLAQPQVNQRTLNVFCPVRLAEMPGAISIDIALSYNSYSGDKTAFGNKWIGFVGMSLREEPLGLSLIETDGFKNLFTSGSSALSDGPLQDELARRRRKANADAGILFEEAFYSEYIERLRQDEELIEREATRLWPDRILAAGTYRSSARGLQTVIKNGDGTYRRMVQNGDVDKFDRLGRLTRHEDRNGNRVDYAYGPGDSIRVSNSHGYVDLEFADGRISQIKDSLGRQWRMQYRKDACLVEISEQDGKMYRFAYDDAGNMLRYERDKETIELAYNDRYECIRRSNARDIRTYERRMADQKSTTIITELNDGQLVRTRRFTHAPRLFEETEVLSADGAVLSVSRTDKDPTTGFPKRTIDQSGNGSEYEYDETGNLRKRVDRPGGKTTEFEYLGRCNQVNWVRVLEAGTWKSTNFDFDDRCNVRRARVYSTQRPGVSDMPNVDIQLEFNESGKISRMRDAATGETIVYAYHPTLQKPTEIRLVGTGTLKTTYATNGDMTTVDTLMPSGEKASAAEQGAVLSKIRTSLDRMLKELRPEGLNIGL